MTIAIDNGLTAITMRFSKSDENEINFNVSMDSCGWLNIGNLIVHQWEATTYPHIVKSWIEFDDKNIF